jgi:putative ABC transport system substrate-binding protein
VPNRRAFLCALALPGIAFSRDVVAQRTGRTARIGYLSGVSAAGNPHYPEAFRRGLRELGWVEGGNVTIEYRFADGRPERLPELARDLVRSKVDVLVAGATPSAVAARNATATIPIVMIAVGDPEGLGLVKSLARPGSNVTGVSFGVGLESFSKSLEMVRQIVPGVSRVAVLLNPANPAQTLAEQEVLASAERLGMRLRIHQARGVDEFERAFATMERERPDALLVVADSMFIQHRARLAELAARLRVPTIYGVREAVEAGGLVSYGPNVADIFRRAAAYVDKILRGAAPGELPVEQPVKFDLVINLKVARALGLTIPPSILVRADEIIE